MKKKIVVCLFIMSMLLSITGCQKRVSTNRDVENDFSTVDLGNLYNDDVYIWIDEETGVNYIIYSHKAGYGGMGGITPRLNNDGSLYLESEE